MSAISDSLLSDSFLPLSPPVSSSLNIFTASLFPFLFFLCLYPISFSASTPFSTPPSMSPNKFYSILDSLDGWYLEGEDASAWACEVPFPPHHTTLCKTHQWLLNEAAESNLSIRLRVSS